MMKKVLLIPFSFLFHFAYAGTGSANDEINFILAIIAVLSIILGVYFLIYFIRRMIKKHREKEIAHLADNANSENIS